MVNDKGECPSGKTPCSLKTTGMNTICIEETKHEEKCPVIDIRFTDSPESFPDYKALSFGNKTLVFTKTEID